MQTTSGGDDSTSSGNIGREDSLTSVRHNPSDSLGGSVVKGTIIAFENEEVVIDVCLKSEGRVPIKEFSTPGHPVDLKVGDEVEVYVERFDDKSGKAVLSREKALSEESWNRLEHAFKEQQMVEGAIFGQVRGGLAVDLGGAVAFLPRSQVDIRPVRDVAPLVNKPEPFLIVKMDRRRGNIVVSRRAVREESRKEQRSETVAEGHPPAIQQFLDPWSVSEDSFNETEILLLDETAWLQAELIALGREANELARSMDATLAYVTERCEMLGKP